MEIVPVIELGCYRHRYVQLPGRSATNDHTTTFIVAVLKSGELGSSPFGPRLLSKSMNQLCGAESFPMSVSVTVSPRWTVRFGPGSVIVAFVSPHPRPAFPCRVTLTDGPSIGDALEAARGAGTPTATAGPEKAIVKAAPRVAETRTPTRTTTRPRGPITVIRPSPPRPQLTTCNVAVIE